MLGSPVYGQLAARLAEDPHHAREILGEDASWDLGLRLFGAVRHHVLTGVALVPAFLTLARDTDLPLDLVELGPSAGLNLVFDRYAYCYAEGTFGDPDALVSFDATERGKVPAALFEAPIEVVERRGIDLNPVDVMDGDDVTLLHSFLWPGLDERVERLDAAIDIFRAAPNRPQLIQGDYVELLPALLDSRSAETLTVVFQTASTGYLEQRRYDELRGALDRAGSDGRPLAWVSTRRREERETGIDDAWELELRIWPGPARLVALIDFHGNWLDWLAAA